MKHALLFLFLLTSIDCFSQDLEHDRLALVALFNATGGERWYTQGRSEDYPEAWVVPGNAGDNPCGWAGIGCQNGRVTEINLNQNDLTGTLPPEIGNLTALKLLSLAGDESVMYSHPPLTGTIPRELGNLVELETLNLVDNVFDGTNADVIFNLTKLKSLSFSPFWPVPSALGNLTDLEDLRISYYGTIGAIGDIGAIPAEIGNLTKLTGLIIGNSGFSGAIPDQIGNLINLKSMHLTDIRNAGPIPSAVGNLTNLVSLSLAKNGHVGTIPATFNNLTKLTYLNLGSNNLIGPLPGLSALRKYLISIGDNKFTFDGMESNLERFFYYGNQKKIAIVKTNGVLSVEAGGTLSNNTFKWYRYGGLVETKVGDNTFIPETSGAYYVEVTNKFATALTLVSETVDSSLPVNLVSFTGRLQSGQNHLTWKTTSETINLGFEIEKSADAQTFEKIGFVDGNGDTHETKNYHFTDTNPFTTTYYRLKQLDRATDGNDGNFEYSRIISVKRENAKLSIHPNPAKDHFLVNGLEREEDMVVRNVEGRILLKRKVVPNQQVMTGSLSNGLYLIQIGGETRKVLIEQ
jgi:hypothetical protein